jgi:hypothetical protein
MKRERENVYLAVAVVMPGGMAYLQRLFEKLYREGNLGACIHIHIGIIAMVIIGIYCMVHWGKQYFSSPNSFLELNSKPRKKALDFAWKWTKSMSILLRKVLKFLWVLGAGVIGYLIISPLIIPIAQYEANRTLAGVGEAYSGLYFSYGLGLIAIYSYYRDKYNQKLKDLAVRFVQSNYQTWINEMDKIAKSQSLKEAKVDPKHTFTLFSSEFSILLFEMPPKKLSVTYIFSNGFISIVSNIAFDILQTSYSYVRKDTPDFFITSHDNWRIEEFHYKDIVELTYKPAETPSESIKTPTGKYPVDGYLIIKLVNGSKKEYPTTKKGATNFIDLAREKVREAKGSSV